MPEWTSATDLRAQVAKRWDKGDVLVDGLMPTSMFPLRLALKAPTSTDWSERFDAVRTWSAELQRGSRAGYRLVLREVRHRVVGTNSVPAEAWVETRDDALRLLGKAADAARFATLADLTRELQPVLLPWLQQHPLRALALADVWPRLLAIVAWLQAHPRPGIYLRQVDLQGVHTKLIEMHRGVLGELLDLALPAEAVDVAATGAAQFARRYGFTDKPLRVRFRWLDPAQANWIPDTDADYAVSQRAFARLDPPASRVYITENEVNFLAMPPTPDAVVIFGGGYGFQSLAQADWLQRRSVLYWGDIDTHGFAILDQLRSHLPHTQSFLMDRATLLAHQPLWTDEPQPVLRDLPRLTDDERALYDDLRWRRLGDTAVRLEQERVAFGWLERCLRQVAPHASNAWPSSRD